MPNKPLNSARRLSRLVELVDRPRKRPAHKLHKAKRKRRQKRTYDVLQSADIFTRYGQITPRWGEPLFIVTSR